MNKKDEVLLNFQVEELEKRYEMGWNKRKKVEIGLDPDIGVKAGIKIDI